MSSDEPPKKRRRTAASRAAEEFSIKLTQRGTRTRRARLTSVPAAPRDIPRTNLHPITAENQLSHKDMNATNHNSEGTPGTQGLAEKASVTDSVSVGGKSRPIIDSEEETDTEAELQADNLGIHVPWDPFAASGIPSASLYAVGWTVDQERQVRAAEFLEASAKNPALDPEGSHVSDFETAPVGYGTLKTGALRSRITWTAEQKATLVALVGRHPEPRYRATIAKLIGKSIIECDAYISLLKSEESKSFDYGDIDAAIEVPASLIEQTPPQQTYEDSTGYIEDVTGKIAQRDLGLINFDALVREVRRRHPGMPTGIISENAAARLLSAVIDISRVWTRLITLASYRPAATGIDRALYTILRERALAGGIVPNVDSTKWQRIFVPPILPDGDRCEPMSQGGQDSSEDESGSSYGEGDPADKGIEKWDAYDMGESTRAGLDHEDEETAWLEALDMHKSALILATEDAAAIDIPPPPEKRSFQLLHFMDLGKS